MRGLGSGCRNGWGLQAEHLGAPYHRLRVHCTSELI